MTHSPLHFPALSAHPIVLHNTLTRTKDALTPHDSGNIRMYVCGPTVYSAPHIGNARSCVVYDVLFRLLRHVYGAQAVCYVRNITDVDDKINEAARQSGRSIQQITQEITALFHADMQQLLCLSPTYEPRVTQHIPQIIEIVEKLIAHGHAYVAQGHVLFAVDSYPHYGALSGRKLEQLVAGSRVEVADYKHHPGDFVLWKPASAGDDDSSVFDSPWGQGRPGWHIECSAMSHAYLGENFDIHGGGADLMFPHHENEVAQSCCAHPGSQYATMWVHNGFLTVEGEKMSKSLGNILTVQQLLQQGMHGAVIRFALLSTHYRKPLDWSAALVEESARSLQQFAEVLAQHDAASSAQPDDAYMQPFFSALCDDMNISVARAIMFDAAKNHPPSLRAMCDFLGFDAVVLSAIQQSKHVARSITEAEIIAFLQQRSTARANKDWAESDRLRDVLHDAGVQIKDGVDGTRWEWV